MLTNIRKNENRTAPELQANRQSNMTGGYEADPDRCAVLSEPKVYFQKAVKIEYKDGTAFELTFTNGEIKHYDMAVLFERFPVLAALRDRELFVSGKLAGGYGIIWNDDIDLEVETVYQYGIPVETEKVDDE